VPSHVVSPVNKMFFSTVFSHENFFLKFFFLIIFNFEGGTFGRVSQNEKFWRIRAEKLHYGGSLALGGDFKKFRQLKKTYKI